MTTLDTLDESSLDGIAGLCRRSLARPPAADELRDCLFAPDQPCIVRGDPDVGVVVAVPADGGGYIRLLAVDPAHQRQGHGRRLLEAAEQDLRAEPNRAGRDAVITVGADAPYYLFAGVETNEIEMLCLLERRHYQRAEANFNMDVDLSDLPPDPLSPGSARGPVVAGPEDREAVSEFMKANWDNWRPEVLRALSKGTLIIDHDESGISGFCAWDVNRRGLLGPVAVRLDLFGKGTGAPMLVAALHRMRDAGRSSIEVSWVGPIVPYARVGGTVGRVFFVYRKTLKPKGAS